MTTKAILLSTGIAANKSQIASSPPAEAPMPAMQKWFSDALAAAVTFARRFVFVRPNAGVGGVSRVMVSFQGFGGVGASAIRSFERPIIAVRADVVGNFHDPRQRPLPAAKRNQLCATAACPGGFVMGDGCYNRRQPRGRQ